MTTLGVTVPYYGGRQVQNPPNVFQQTTGAAPSPNIAAKPGDIVVDTNSDKYYGAVTVTAGNQVVWTLLGGASGAVTSVLGTPNQVSVNTVANVASVSLPAAITAPGSLATTTTLASGTTITAGTGITSTTGNITASAGNLVATVGQVSAAAGASFGGNVAIATGNLSLTTAGGKVNIATGANATAGTTGALVGGTLVVANTAVTASSKFFFSTNTLGTVTRPQAYYVSARTPGTNFTILSQDATDTSTVDFWFIN